VSLPLKTIENRGKRSRLSAVGWWLTLSLLLMGCQTAGSHRPLVVQNRVIEPAGAPRVETISVTNPTIQQTAGTTESTGVAPAETMSTPEYSPVVYPTYVTESGCKEKLARALYGPPPAINFRSDLHNSWDCFVDDARSVVTWKNAALLGIATGATIAVHQEWDGKVRSYTAKHPERWGDAGEALGYLGDFSVQIPALAGFYGYTLWEQDEELHDLSTTMISAFAVTSTTNTIIKGIVNSDRPSDEFNGGRYGFPSYHTASSFTLAAVLDEYYGPKVGIPAYMLAGAIGWTRIDQRDHDLSDVIFGAALGTIIGKTIAQKHHDSRTEFAPFYDPQNGATGMQWGVRY